MKIMAVILGAIFWVFFYYSPAGAEVLKERALEAGGEISHITYEEPGVMEEKGLMYGVSASYTYHRPDPKLMLKAQGRFSAGQVDYSSSSSGEMDNIDDYIFELRGLGGYDFIISSTSAITPYLGLGYRYLNDDSSGMTTSTGAKGYERESNYCYSPIGLEVISELQNGWSLGGLIEYDYFWSGKQKSHLSNAVAAFGDLKNDQDDGYGLRGAIKFKKESDKVDFLIEPFIRYWNIEKSNESEATYQGVIIGYGYEPKNNSTEIGLNFVISF